MLWGYQIELVEKALPILREKHIVYLALEMRLGKTLISLEVARRIGAKNVLFVTKKKAMQSIRKDFERGGYEYNITIVNFEQLHKVCGKFDVVIVDEAHLLGAFPKPSLRTKRLRRIVGDAYLILLSGTPTPESYSQIFHQFWVSKYSPFPHSNFYRWAEEYVDVYEIFLYGQRVRKYDRAKQEKIENVIRDYFVTYTRVQAGFSVVSAKEFVHRIRVAPYIHEIAHQIARRGLAEIDENIVIADTAAKKMWKLHQLYSGTIILDDGRRKILDFSKAKYIWNRFSDRIFVVYYKYQAERKVLQQIFPLWTEDVSRFSNGVPLLVQIQSGSMGLDFSRADAIVFYNIDFSATNYWQARARLFHRDRQTQCEIHWIFAQGGIEERIFDVVRKKKDYTVSYFRRDFFGKLEKVEDG